LSTQCNFEQNLIFFKFLRVILNINDTLLLSSLIRDWYVGGEIIATRWCTSTALFSPSVLNLNNVTFQNSDPTNNLTEDLLNHRFFKFAIHSYSVESNKNSEGILE